MESAEDQDGRQLARIKLEYTNLPTASLKRLDELLLNWARWHSETYVEGFVPREISSGAVVHCPDTMRLNAELTVLDDRPAAPNKSATQTMWFNVQYEQKADVPEYDRASTLPLLRKRGIIDTIDGDDDNAGGHGGGDSGPRSGGGGKRQRTGQRCFNCGSYGHSLRQCWKELDAERVDAERQAMGGGIRGIPRRYFLDEEEGIEGGAGPTGGVNGSANGNGDKEGILDPVKALRKEFPDVLPGKLSSTLRSALSIGEHDPPPWLHTMRTLGLPPAYNIVSSNEHDIPPPPPPPGGPSPKSHPLQLGPGDEEEGEDEKEEGEVAPSPPLDKPPVPREPADDGIEPGNNRRDIEGDEAIEDFMALPSEDALRVEDSTLDTSAPITLEHRATVLFPGVNAPVPPEGDPAAWEDRTIQNAPHVHWSGENGGNHVQQQQHYQQQHYAQQPYGGYHHHQQQHYHYHYQPPPHPGEGDQGVAWQQQQQQWDPAQYPNSGGQQPWGTTPPPPGQPPPAPPPPPPY